MRILIVGAGAVGGYFGARLLAGGRDVTFLVRPGREAQLARVGLPVRSAYGDLDIVSPPTVAVGALRTGYDLVLLSCKAYDLGDAMNSFAPAVGPETVVLPLLNGLGHLELLEERFGPRVLGGYCLISSRLEADGRINHLSKAHTLAFGALHGHTGVRIDEVAGTLSDAGFDARSSEDIMQEMWEKWVFIASLAAATCLMRASSKAILAAGGEEFVRKLFAECADIATANGYGPSEEARQRTLLMLTDAGSPLSASMLNDIERGARTEGDHILGDLLDRGQRPAGDPRSPLALAYMHMRAYEARRNEPG